MNLDERLDLATTHKISFSKIFGCSSSIDPFSTYPHAYMNSPKSSRDLHLIFFILISKDFPFPWFTIVNIYFYQCPQSELISCEFFLIYPRIHLILQALQYFPDIFLKNNFHRTLDLLPHIPSLFLVLYNLPL